MAMRIRPGTDHRPAASPPGHAFTLIELLVVVAIIALLIAILLPTLSSAREQGKRVKCLANLRSIGAALYQYALEDRAEQPIPIHEAMLQPRSYWEWRTVIWFAWGGRSGQIPFLTAPGAGLLLSANGPTGHAEYDARRRPLNRFVFANVNVADTKQMEWFHCPSDRGYPQHTDIDDSPFANAARPCYDTLGNSYRASLAMVSLADVGGTCHGLFSYGPWGHRLGSLRNASQLALIGEPQFFNMIGRDDVAGPTPDPVLVTGWHRQRMSDNLAFCDGSARAARASRLYDFAPDTIEQMGVFSADFLARGRSWQLDCFPTPGARLWGDANAWRGEWGLAYDTLWPFANRQENFVR